MTDDDPNSRKRAAIAEVMPETPYVGRLGVVCDTYEHDDVTLRLGVPCGLTDDGTVHHGGGVAAVIQTYRIAS